MGAYRQVARQVVHASPLGFRELCAAAIPSSTRFIVLDLDRTLHLARHMGERFGWELGAYRSYGPSYVDELAELRRRGGMWARLSASRHVVEGARVWAYPGAYYLLWGKLAARHPSTQRLRYQRFGESPYTAIQALPTIALMHELAGMGLGNAGRLADRVLDRFSGQQIFDASDIDWLRQRYPGVRIILSSASPRPTVEAAARRLGIADWECAEIEVHRGRYSAPFQLSPLYSRRTLPDRITPPRHYRVNAGRAKVDRLLERYPALAAPGAEVVGITDTWHGEDHSWADVFTRVIDVNSRAPFSPLVNADSPLQAIHSAHVLTFAERERRASGDATYVDPRRRKYLPSWCGGELRPSLANYAVHAIAGEVEHLAAHRRALVDAGRHDWARLEARIDDAYAAIEAAVDDYNLAPHPLRGRRLAAVNRPVRAHQQLLRQLLRAQRAASEIALAIDERRAAARAAVVRAQAPIRKIRVSRVSPERAASRPAAYAAAN